MKIWHLADLSREPTTVEPASGLINLEFSSDGSRLAGLLRHGTAGVTAQLWDTATGKRLAHVTVSDFWAQGPGFAFSADGTRVAALSGSIKPQIFLWDCASGLELKLLRSMPISTTARLRHLVLSLDGRRIVAWDDIGRVLHVLDTDTGEYQTLRSRMPIFSAAFSADGTRVLTSGFQNVTAKEASLQVSGSAVQEWAIQPSKVAAEDRGPLPDRKLHAEIKIWSPDGSRQAAYSFPSTTLVVKMGDVTEIRILDRAGKQIRVFSDQLAVFKSMVFSPDGRLVFSRAENGEVKICETDSGQVRWAANLATLYQAKNVGVPRPPADDICAFSRDGQLVAVPSPEGVKIVSTADF